MLFVFNEAGVPSVGKIVRMGIATDPNPAIDPVLTNPGAQTSTVGAVVDLALSASDPNGDVLTYAATGLPPGLAIDASSGRITGTPDDRGQLQRRRLGDRRHQHRDAPRFVWTMQAATPLILETPAGAGLRRRQRRRELHAPARAAAAACCTSGTSATAPPDTDWSTSATATHAYASSGHLRRHRQRRPTTAVRCAAAASSRPCTCRPPRSRRPRRATCWSRTRPAANPRLWVVNQDNDSVSVFDAVTLAKLGEVAVGTAPRSIARAPNGMIWVTNKQSGDHQRDRPGRRAAVARTIALPRGSQPFGIVMSPVANVAYVVLEAGGQIAEVRHDELRADRQRRDRPECAASVDQRRRRAALRLALRHAARCPARAPRRSRRPRAPAARCCSSTRRRSPWCARSCCSTATRPTGENPGPRHPELPRRRGDLADGSAGLRAVEAGQHQARRAARRHRAELREDRARDHLAHRPRRRSAEDRRRGSTTTTRASRAPRRLEPSGVYLFVALETSREVAVLDAFSALRAAALRRRPRAAGPRDLDRRAHALRPQLHGPHGRRLRPRAPARTAASAACRCSATLAAVGDREARRRRAARQEALLRRARPAPRARRTT